ncbi:SidC homolog [Legionella sainthelensi]|uniref:hypothetical protein n=1 Tax=Legionella sainthelensi TaxID=28087 RepID=UPI000F70098C|nr:hypothetical protein [Legionella sainthelensi]VEB35688.1 SidC homolog [Legionella sainthelensi]
MFGRFFESNTLSIETVKVSLHNYRFYSPFYDPNSKSEYVFEKNAAVALLASMKDSTWGAHIWSHNRDGKQVAAYDHDGNYHTFTMTKEWREAASQSAQSFLMSNKNAQILKNALEENWYTHPALQTRQFLHDIAKGKQEEAEVLLTATPANTQMLLRTPSIFTDYSGRTFNCTAYEYAYWAKDTHMCRMLERHMDEETKAQMLARIDEMERIDAQSHQAVGLVYQQREETHRSVHFDFTPLKNALQQYVDGYDTWRKDKNWDAMGAAWMRVGIAQRDVPAHIAHEYCRPDRSFWPLPEFNEATLPRILIFNNFNTGRDEFWFPSGSSNSGFGFDFAVVRMGTWPEGASGRRVARGPEVDLAAITHLDEVRTAELIPLRERLNQPEIPHALSTQLI